MTDGREHCILCMDHTGKAGRSDDSIYIEDFGPLCELCNSILEPLRVEIERLREALTSEAHGHKCMTEEVEKLKLVTGTLHREKDEQQAEIERLRALVIDAACEFEHEGTSVREAGFLGIARHFDMGAKRLRNKLIRDSGGEE